ncbi:hypothetical protein HMPREF1594_03609 [Escherichia coli 907446]|nr:hypothetical protein HMPREF1594_03609 [Escherichia coli 907446]ESE12243.1 hypothetical protein HMPREF1615_00246 [Escherichia coli 908632]
MLNIYTFFVFLCDSLISAVRAGRNRRATVKRIWLLMILFD